MSTTDDRLTAAELAAIARLRRAEQAWDAHALDCPACEQVWAFGRGRPCRLGERLVRELA